ncbi:hypothetical protein [Natrinema caseinilyticum]|uniref:hypothetical protein n=1 Tax=Natrinema caseinilyticum TaxID=2961570 RepID=UPI0020C35BE5|nr:hypothetical protein [Natrinema caseinilyticum]
MKPGLEELDEGVLVTPRCERLFSTLAGTSHPLLALERFVWTDVAFRVRDVRVTPFTGKFSVIRVTIALLIFDVSPVTNRFEMIVTNRDGVCWVRGFTAAPAVRTLPGSGDRHG